MPAGSPRYWPEAGIQLPIAGWQKEKRGGENTVGLLPAARSVREEQLPSTPRTLKFQMGEGSACQMNAYAIWASSHPLALVVCAGRQLSSGESWLRSPAGHQPQVRPRRPQTPNLVVDAVTENGQMAAMMVETARLQTKPPMGSMEVETGCMGIQLGKDMG